MPKDILFDAAQEAIDDVFSYKSVSPQETVDQLEELQADIDVKIEVLKEEIRRKEEEV